MIDEVLEAESYLRGQGITQDTLYRACFSIGRLFMSQGMSKVEARTKIFEWAQDHDIYIPFSINKVLYHVENTDRTMRSNVQVYVNEDDIKEIDKRFDSRVTKKIALAMLCYAKAVADKNGDFQISSNALSNLTGVNPANVRGRYLKELVDFEYVSKKQQKNSKAWRRGDSYANSSNWYHINVPCVNEGKWHLNGNDICGLFREIYG